MKCEQQPRAEFLETVWYICAQKGRKWNKDLQRYLVLKSVLDVFGKKDGVTRSSHRTTDHRLGFQSRKKIHTLFLAPATPFNSHARPKASKVPPVQTTPVTHNSLPPRYVNIQYLTYKITTWMPEGFLWHPPALPQAGEAHAEKDHLLSSFTYLWWYILQWHKFFPYTHMQRTQPEDLVGVPQNSTHPAQDCNTQR